MWDARYQSNEYAYGTEPNDFLRENEKLLPKGKVLCLAEGEGRNAVYLAKHGYQVTAVDLSTQGIKKGKKLAAKNNVDIEFVHADLATFDMGIAKWDAIVSIFCPLPSVVRRELHGKVMGALKPNGVFLVEAYTPAQVHNDTGGGKDIDVMQSRDSLSQELKGLNFTHLLELERDIQEGIYHTGKGAVLQAIAVRAQEPSS